MFLPAKLNVGMQGAQDGMVRGASPMGPAAL